MVVVVVVVLAEKLNVKVAELSQQLLEKQEIDAHMRSAFDQINSEYAYLHNVVQKFALTPDRGRFHPCLSCCLQLATSQRRSNIESL